MENNRLYTDFEPYCVWHRKEDTDTLDVDLKGFKREQLKVRVEARTLTISGERPLNDNNKWSLFCKQITLGEQPLDDNNKWSRFSKQIKLPDNIKVKNISSKFTGGILTVVMPKEPEIRPMIISLKLDVIHKDAGGWWFKMDKNMGLKVGVVLVFFLLGFGICVKCLRGKPVDPCAILKRSW